MFRAVGGAGVPSRGARNQTLSGTPSRATAATAYTHADSPTL